MVLTAYDRKIERARSSNPLCRNNVSIALRVCTTVEEEEDDVAANSVEVVEEEEEKEAVTVAIGIGII